MTKQTKLFFLFCILLFPSSLKAEVVNKIKAVVGSEIITQTDLKNAIKAQKATLKLSDEEIEQQALDSLVDSLLFDQTLKNSKVEVSDADVDKAIVNILEQNHLSRASLQAELKQNGMSFDQYKEQMRREIKRVKFVNQFIGPRVKITDQDLKDYYQENQEIFRGVHEVGLAQIILPLAEIKDQQEFEALYKKATDISKQAQAGDMKTFKELAKKHSKDQAASQGGDLGMVNVKDLSPEIARAVRDLSLGQVSFPLLTPNSITIIKLVSLPELSSKDFDRLRDDIYNVLYDKRVQEELQNYLQQQRQGIYIDIR